MDDFIIELEWSDDLNLMRQMCIDLYNITPNLVTNQPRSEYFKEVFEKKHAYGGQECGIKLVLSLY